MCFWAETDSKITGGKKPDGNACFLTNIISILAASDSCQYDYDIDVFSGTANLGTIYDGTVIFNKAPTCAFQWLPETQTSIDYTFKKSKTFHFTKPGMSDALCS